MSHISINCFVYTINDCKNPYPIFKHGMKKTSLDINIKLIQSCVKENTCVSFPWDILILFISQMRSVCMYTSVFCIVKKCWTGVNERTRPTATLRTQENARWGMWGIVYDMLCENKKTDGAKLKRSESCAKPPPSTSHSLTMMDGENGGRGCFLSEKIPSVESAGSRITQIIASQSHTASRSRFCAG